MSEICPECNECILQYITASRDDYDYEVIAIVCNNCRYER